MCHQHRQAKFGIYPPLGDTSTRSGWPDSSVATPMMIIDRPFRCTIGCCCVLFNPPKAYTQIPIPNSNNDFEHPEDIPTNTIGAVELNWKWWNVCCCDFAFDIQDYQQGVATPSVPYTVQVPLLFGRGCMNCCAPTCFKPIFKMPILNANNEVVGELQNQVFHMSTQIKPSLMTTLS